MRDPVSRNIVERNKTQDLYVLLWLLHVHSMYPPLNPCKGKTHTHTHNREKGERRERKRKRKRT